jgi:hypothetical protein
MGNNLSGNGEFLIYIWATKQFKEYLTKGFVMDAKDLPFLIISMRYLSASVIFAPVSGGCI